MTENALAAAQNIVRWMEAEMDMGDLMYTLEEVFPGYTSEGIALKFESFIAHQYSEEPRHDAVPFTD